MEEMPRIEKVYHVIDTLYHNPDCNKNNEADRWLRDLQGSKFAWEIAKELLQRQIDVNSCCLGALMMKNKIISSFHELPEETIFKLHNFLMHLLSQINKETNNVIVTEQLCAAVVDLTLQISTCTNPISEFLSQPHDKIPPMVMLEILRVFPEEMNTKQMRLGANRRNEIQEELSNCSRSLNDYLKLVTTEDESAEVLLQAVKCFTSWVSVNKDISTIVECDLIPKVLKILRNPSDETLDMPTNIESKLHDAAADLLCCVLRCLKSSPADSVLNVHLFQAIKDFEIAYHRSVARESVEKSLSYCHIFSELGEAFLDKMLEETPLGNYNYAMEALDLILMCVGHHDYEVCSITFNFWFILAEVLYRRNDEVLCARFKPHITRLLEALCRQVQMEPDHEGLLDDQDEFNSFREKVCDLVRDVTFIVGSTKEFCRIFYSMKQSSESLMWNQTEAYLYIMYAVLYRIDLDENTTIPEAVETIFKLPEETHVAIKYTALLIIGELRDWFAHHPFYLKTALEYLAYNLGNNEVSDAAATSMCGICYAAKDSLTDEFHVLLHILEQNTYKLTNKSAIALIRAVTAVMSRLPVTEIADAMKKICWHQVEPLRKMLEDHNSNNVENNTNFDPIPSLDRLAAVFRFVEPTSSNDLVSNEIRNACVPAFSMVQPVLFRIMHQFQNNVIAMERCCRCIRFAVRTLRRNAVYLLQALVETLEKLYRENQHSCFLYLGSILVDEFGNDVENWDRLLQMVDAFKGPTFALLQNDNCVRAYADTIDDLFRLCSRILQRLPIVFLGKSSICWPFIECGLAAIYLEHEGVNSSIMKFFHETFDCSNADDHTTNGAIKRETVRPIYEKYGEVLVYNLLHASAFVLSSYDILNVAEVIFDLIQFDTKETIKWIKLAVEKLPNQNSVGKLMVSPEQIQIFLNSCEKATKVRDISKSLRDFSLFYR